MRSKHAEAGAGPEHGFRLFVPVERQVQTLRPRRAQPGQACGHAVSTAGLTQVKLTGTERIM